MSDKVADLRGKAAGHNYVTFCNVPCAPCEREMDRRAALAKGKFLRSLSITMKEAPRG